MSADNGVYILASRGRKARTLQGFEIEYRVAHVQAIENIELHPDYPTNSETMLNREYLMRYFSGSRVFTDRNLANGYAIGIFDHWMRELGVVEHGIVCLYQYARIPFPPQPHLQLHEPHMINTFR